MLNDPDRPAYAVFGLQIQPLYSLNRGALMSELASSLQMLGAIKDCFCIEFPSKRWGFVGQVPAVLSYEQLNGDPVTQEQFDDIRKFGPGLVRSCRRRSWPTREAA